MRMILLFFVGFMVWVIATQRDSIDWIYSKTVFAAKESCENDLASQYKVASDFISHVRDAIGDVDEYLAIKGFSFAGFYYFILVKSETNYVAAGYRSGQKIFIEELRYEDGKALFEYITDSSNFNLKSEYGGYIHHVDCNFVRYHANNVSRDTYLINILSQKIGTPAERLLWKVNSFLDKKVGDFKYPNLPKGVEFKIQDTEGYYQEIGGLQSEFEGNIFYELRGYMPESAK